jgi:ubiquinone/menaquinone biosynthesis C-methylase UbiE
MSLARNEHQGSRGRHLYDEAFRRRWQDAGAILADIGLKPGATFIDLGCGEGFFALPAARLVGPGGMVYGLDTRPEAVGRLRERASSEGLTNLRLKVGRAEDTVLCEACADFVFFGIVLHDFDEPARVLANAARMLKPRGRLVNLDWKKEATGLGPPLQIRFSQEKAIQFIEAGGFKVQTVTEVGPYHYLIMAGLES